MPPFPGPETPMDLLISNAWAQGAAPPAGGGIGELVFMFALLFAVFYFMLWRPQAKRQKEHRDLLARLAKGDEAVTTGGIVGRVKDVGDNFVLIEIAKGVEVRIQKSFVQSILPKGTMKTL